MIDFHVKGLQYLTALIHHRVTLDAVDASELLLTEALVEETRLTYPARTAAVNEYREQGFLERDMESKTIYA